MNELKEILVENINTSEKIKLKNLSDLEKHFKDNLNILNFINYNKNRFSNILEYSYNCFYVENLQITLITKKKTSRKKKGNGQGSIYYDNNTQSWAGQYTYNGKRKPAVHQRKGETKTEFVTRFNEILASINNGSYLDKTKENLYSILKRYIEQKYKDGITKDRSYVRNLDTLKSIEKSCENFIYKPIQQITVEDIEDAKEKIRQYKKNSIDKIWSMLNKGFKLAQSRKKILYNIMEDENLLKPVSNIPFEKVIPLTVDEEKKLNEVLDGPERNHKYRNIVKLELITSMRIGEVLSRSLDDIIEITDTKKILNIHNTLTEELDNTDSERKRKKIVIGEHTKTYNKTTGIDNGVRYYPIDNQINEILQEQINKKITNIYKLFFWDYEKNKFITPQEVNSWLYRLNKKYKISKKLHNHKLRHTRLSRWKEQGMDMTAIQYLAGHVEDSNVTTDVYIDISTEYAFEELEKTKKIATA